MTRHSRHLAVIVLAGIVLRAAMAQPPAVNQTRRYPLPNAVPAANIAPPPVQPPPATPAPPAEAPLPPQAVLFAPGQIVARVGDKTILYGDVAPTVNLIMSPILAKAKSQGERDAIEAQREALTKNIIQQVVQTKMLLMEFERSMPSELRADVKKRTEAEGKMKKSIRTQFDMQLNAAREKIANASQEDIDKMLRQDPTIMRLAVLMKERHLESPGELDQNLRQFGTSLEQQIKDFSEYIMGMEAARTALNLGSGKKPKKEITHQEILDYYQAHIADYAIPAKARFEILTARTSRFGGSRQAARDAVAQWGNEVLLGGTPFPAVARKYSQEPHAQDGGYYDWITPGSLASQTVDQAVFSLEVEKLSQIIEDDTGFHIIHVLERKEAGRLSFIEAQPEIREAIDNERRSAERQKYLTDLRARTIVWTIYDPPAEAAVQPAGAAGP